MKIARFPSLSAYPCLIANGGIKRLTPFAATVSALANLHILILAKLRCALSDVQCAQLPQQLMLCLAVVFGSSPGSLMAADDETMQPFEVEYDVGNNLITAGSAKLSLKQVGDEWIYSLSTLPSGIFKLTGRGTIQELSVLEYTGQQLITKRYSYRQDNEAKRSMDAWFDWKTNEVTYRNRGEEIVKKIDDPILDRLSATLSIRAQLRAGFDEAVLQVFDGGDIKTVVFENEGTETLNTRLGRQEAIRVKSYSRDGSRKRMTTTWFAPALNFVPVVIEQHKQGKLVARLTISKLNP